MSSEFDKEKLWEVYRYGGRFSLSEFAKDEGIDVYEIEFDDDNVDGVLTKEKNDWKIYVNKNRPHEEKRFIVAHELGHFVDYKSDDSKVKKIIDKAEKENKWFQDSHLESNYVVGIQMDDKNRKEDDDYIKAEKEANEIAEKILMPEDLVKVFLIKEKEKDISEISDKLSKIFDVSKYTMMKRIQNIKKFKALVNFSK